MSKKKDKSPLDTETPRARGGRRGPTERSLANLRKWKPGESGNPKGCSKTALELTALARSYCPAAIERLYQRMMDDKTPEAVQVKAAELMLDRGLGRAPITSTTISIDGGEMTGDATGLTALLLRARMERKLIEGKAERHKPTAPRKTTNGEKSPLENSEPE